MMASDTAPSTGAAIITKADLGLKIYYPDTESSKCTIDIVAIHGIGAHPDKTWTSEGVNWLRDTTMLPHVLPQARIMRFGYRSNWYANNNEPTVFLNPGEIAEILLTQLKDKRKDDPLRPLIFIGHCYGGLIVMQALVDASDRIDDWPDIFRATTGMVFLGVPFRGADGMDAQQLVEEAAKHYRGNIRQETLQMLKRGDAHLVESRQRFLRTLKSDPAHIHCFFETVSCNVNAIVRSIEGAEIPEHRQGLIVDRTSGTLDAKRSIIDNHPLQRSHFDINKFESPDELDFKTVTNVLQELVDEALKDPRWSRLRYSRLLTMLNKQPQLLRAPAKPYWENLTMECHSIYEQICNEYISIHRSINRDIYLNKLQALLPDRRLSDKLAEVWSRLAHTTYPVAKNYAMVALYMMHVETNLRLQLPAGELVYNSNIKARRFNEERRSKLKRFNTWIRCPCGGSETSHNYCGYKWAFPNEVGLCKVKVTPDQCRQCALSESFIKSGPKQNLEDDELALLERAKAIWIESRPPNRIPQPPQSGHANGIPSPAES